MKKLISITLITVFGLIGLSAFSLYSEDENRQSGVEKDLQIFESCYYYITARFVEYGGEENKVIISNVAGYDCHPVVGRANIKNDYKDKLKEEYPDTRIITTDLDITGPFDSLSEARKERSKDKEDFLSDNLKIINFKF